MTEHPDERQPQVRAWLERGWEWLNENADHPKVDEFFDQWLEVLHTVLRKYEETYGMEDDDGNGGDDAAQVRMSG